MADGSKGFLFEEIFTKALESGEINYFTQVIYDYFGFGKEVKHIGNHYKDTGDILYGGNRIELKYVSQGNGTLGNIGFGKMVDILGLPKFPLTIYRIYLLSVGIKVKWKLRNIFSKKEAKDFSLSNLNDEFIKFDKKIRQAYVEILYNFLISNLDKLKAFIEYIIDRKLIRKGIPDLYLVCNSRLNKVTAKYTKEDIENLKNIKEIKLTPNGIDFGSFRIQIAWKNHTGYNLALYAFIN